MTKYSRILALTLILTLAYPFSGVEGSQNNSIQEKQGKQIVISSGSTKVLIAGEERTIKAVPFEIDGTTMAPLRYIFEDVLEANVHWIANQKTINIYENAKIITLKVNEKKTIVDGEEYILNRAPVIKDGYTYVPLRFLSEAMGLVVAYNSQDKTITITQKPKEIILPLAQFSLPDNLIGGQALTYLDQSYDPSGYAIVDRTWEIINNDNEVIRTASLTSTMSRPTAGLYSIRMKVRNAKNIWSNWTEKTMEVLPNTPPKILELGVEKNTLAMGEPIKISYEIENEHWEEIIAERWFYSWSDRETSHVKIEKPRAFFQPGEYKITLQVKDASGNWSEEAETIVKVSGSLIMTEKEYKFSNPRPGELFLNLEAENFNLIKSVTDVEYAHQDITLITSNNPEKIQQSGILYQDKASGKIRVRYHHQNDTKDQLYTYAVAENTSDKAIEVKLLNRGMAGPSADAKQVGQQVVLSYLESDYNKSITLLPNQKLILNSGQKALKPKEVLSGMFDLESTDALLFSIVAVTEAKKDSNLDYFNLPVLQKEGSHVRGTFSQANIDLFVNLKEADSQKIIIGRSDAYDNYFLEGTDNITGEKVVNNGNRGVVHTIKVTSAQRMGIILNPRGTSFKGAIKIDNDTHLLADAGVLYGSQEGVVLGTIEKNETKTFKYLAPSGSDTPILIVFIPEEQW